MAALPGACGQGIEKRTGISISTGFPDGGAENGAAALAMRSDPGFADNLGATLLAYTDARF